MSSLWSMSSVVLNPLPMLCETGPRAFFTASATCTVFEPGCLTTSTMTASCPFRRAMVRRSATPSVTRATSPRRTWEPFLEVATGRFWISSTFWNSPSVRTVSSVGPSERRPAGRFRFSAPMRCAISKGLVPAAFALSRSTSTWISRTSPPVTRTSATPSSCCRAGWRRSSMSLRRRWEGSFALAA